MKVTRRSENGKSGHLLISVPASRVAEVEAALTFLEEKRQKRGSQVVSGSDRPGSLAQWMATATAGKGTVMAGPGQQSAGRA